MPTSSGPSAATQRLRPRPQGRLLCTYASKRAHVLRAVCCDTATTPQVAPGPVPSRGLPLLPPPPPLRHGLRGRRRRRGVRALLTPPLHLTAPSHKHSQPMGAFGCGCSTGCTSTQAPACHEGLTSILSSPVHDNHSANGTELGRGPCTHVHVSAQTKERGAPCVHAQT